MIFDLIDNISLEALRRDVELYKIILDLSK